MKLECGCTAYSRCLECESKLQQEIDKLSDSIQPEPELVPEIDEKERMKEFFFGKKKTYDSIFFDNNLGCCPICGERFHCPDHGWRLR